MQLIHLIDLLVKPNFDPHNYSKFESTNFQRRKKWRENCSQLLSVSINSVHLHAVAIFTDLAHCRGI